MTRPLVELRNRYRGAVAAGYDAERAGPQWDAEHAFVAAQVAELAPRTVLDVPMGTGRFLPLYQDAGCQFFGIDNSADMIAQAVARGWPEGRTWQGDALALPRARVFDLIVAVRFLNWLAPDELPVFLWELRRACRGHVVVSLESGRRQGRPMPHPESELEAARFRITARETIQAGRGRTYSMLRLTPSEGGTR